MSHHAPGVNAHRRAAVDCYARDTRNISFIPIVGPARGATPAKFDATVYGVADRAKTIT